MLRNKLLNMYLQNGFNKKQVKNPDDYCGPFLIDVNESYLTAKNKIMIFGQETFGWKYFSDYELEIKSI